MRSWYPSPFESTVHTKGRPAMKNILVSACPSTSVSRNTHITCPVTLDTSTHKFSRKSGLVLALYILLLGPSSRNGHKFPKSELATKMVTALRDAKPNIQDPTNTRLWFLNSITLTLTLCTTFSDPRNQQLPGRCTMSIRQPNPHPTVSTVSAISEAEAELWLENKHAPQY